MENIKEERVTDLEKVQAELQAAKDEIEELKANHAKEIEAKYITSTYLQTYYLSAEEIRTHYLDADTIGAKYATIANLNAVEAKIKNLDVDAINANFGKYEKLFAQNAEFHKLVASDAEIEDLRATNLTVVGKLNADKAEIDTLIANKVSTNDFEYYTFEELVKKFKETGKEFILQWNRSPFEGCGLALTVEEEKGLDKQEDSTFVYHLTLEGFLEAIAKAYQNEKDEGKPLNKDFEYFAGNSTPEHLTNFFKCDWDISNIEVKKKRLFSKGYAKAHVKGHIEKPQVLIDLQNKINEKLKGTNYVCVALPFVAAVYDAEKVSSDFCFTNPDKKSGDEYRRAERDLIARIKDKTQFNIEMDCKWNEYGPSSEEAIREHFKTDDPSFAICIYKQN